MTIYLFSALDDQISTMDKFCLYVFIDLPTPKVTTIYLEICSTSCDAFKIEAPILNEINEEDRFYFDFESCSHCISNYKLIDSVTGEHFQNIGEKEKRIRVVPCNFNIDDVQPHINNKNYISKQINFVKQNSRGNCRGGWLSWTQKTPPLNNDSPFTICIADTNIQIDSFHSYILFPKEYDSNGAICRIISRDNELNPPLKRPTHSFRLNTEFPIFLQWKRRFFNHTIIRTRDPLSFSHNSEVQIDTIPFSPQREERDKLQYFIVGALFTVSINIFIACLFYSMQMNFLSQTNYLLVLLGSLLFSVLSGMLIWKKFLKNSIKKK
mgnify:FL=1